MLRNSIAFHPAPDPRYLARIGWSVLSAGLSDFGLLLAESGEAVRRSRGLEDVINGLRNPIVPHILPATRDGVDRDDARVAVLMRALAGRNLH
jgi:hypothetical protein